MNREERARLLDLDPIAVMARASEVLGEVVRGENSTPCDCGAELQPGQGAYKHAGGCARLRDWSDADRLQRVAEGLDVIIEANDEP